MTGSQRRQTRRAYIRRLRAIDRKARRLEMGQANTLEVARPKPDRDKEATS